MFTPLDDDLFSSTPPTTTTTTTTPHTPTPPDPHPSRIPWSRPRLSPSLFTSLPPLTAPTRFLRAAQQPQPQPQPRVAPKTDDPCPVAPASAGPRVSFSSPPTLPLTYESAYVSENGTPGFDAVYRAWGGHSSPAVSIHPPALLHLALGVPSHTFVFDVTSGQFIGPASLRLPYASTASSQSLLGQFLTLGSHVKRLEMLVEFLPLRGRIAACFADELGKILQEYRYYVILVREAALARPESQLTPLEIYELLRLWASRFAFLAKLVGCHINPPRQLPTSSSPPSWDLDTVLNTLPSGPALLRHLASTSASHHADAPLAPLARRLLHAASCPVLDAIEALIFEGRVHNPDGELPLVASPDAAVGFTTPGQAASAWHAVAGLAPDPDSTLPPFLQTLLGPAVLAARSLSCLRAIEQDHYVFEPEARFPLTLTPPGETEDDFRAAVVFHNSAHADLVSALREAAMPDTASAQARLQVARAVLRSAAEVRAAQAVAKREAKAARMAEILQDRAAARERAAQAAEAERLADAELADGWRAEAAHYARAREELTDAAREEIREYYRVREAQLESKIAHAEWRSSRLGRRGLLLDLLSDPAFTASSYVPTPVLPPPTRRVGLWRSPDTVDDPSDDTSDDPSDDDASDDPIDAVDDPSDVVDDPIDAVDDPSDVVDDPSGAVDDPSNDTSDDPSNDAPDATTTTAHTPSSTAHTPSTSTPSAPTPSSTTPSSTTPPSTTPTPTQLQNRVATQVRLINRAVLYLFMHPLALQSHLHALRDTLLMGAGDFAHTLNSLLFQRLDDVTRGKPSDTELSLILEAAGDANPETRGLDRLTLRWDPEVGEEGDGMVAAAPWSPFESRALNGLALEYEIPPPLDLIVDSGALESYRATHILFLRISRASHMLTDLWHRFHDPSLRRAIPGVAGARLRRLQHIRAQMQHFVSIMQGYFTSQILDGAYTGFMDVLASSVDSLEDLQGAHAEFVHALASRCLLTPQAKPVMNVIEGILANITKYYQLVSSQPGLGSLSSANMARFDTVVESFSAYSTFLFKLLSNLVVRGHAPHLEDLLIRLNFNTFFTPGQSSGLQSRR